MVFELYYGLGGGLVTGLLLAWLWIKWKLGSIESTSQNIIAAAEAEVTQRRTDWEAEADRRIRHELKKIEEYWQEERAKIREAEDRFERKREKVLEQSEAIKQRRKTLETESKALATRTAKLLKQEQELAEHHHRLADLTPAAAQEQVLAEARQRASTDAAEQTRQILEEATSQAKTQAQKMIASAISRIDLNTLHNSMVDTVVLPSEEMKGRVIGREGRNIRALEEATGATISIDDQANTVVMSAYDPIRRHVAKMAIQHLIADGRIHPSRIEEVVQLVRTDVERQVLEHGMQAAMQAGVSNLHTELHKLLGTMHFRQILGQNLLQHSLEVSAIMGLIAAELNLDVPLARRIGLLHDVGKVVTQDAAGNHARVGRDIALKYGESDVVANGIACHHGEGSPDTIEGSLCELANALSSSRPGARRSADEYFHRQRHLEEIALQFPGVDSAYALNAGEELRVAILAEMIDDAGAVNLARDLAARIRSDKECGGRVKVTVIRERRSVAYTR